MKHVVFSSLCFGLLILSACNSDEVKKAGSANPGYVRLLRVLYRNTVPTMLPATLADELRQPTAPLLLDVRTPAEYKVSHLHGARFVNFDSIRTTTFADLDHSQPVIVYCSVGYRSERLGERLHALGFQNVRNLYGGLFEWVNQGYPVYNAQGVTANVHPYSPMWSPWLQRGHKVYN